VKEMTPEMRAAASATRRLAENAQELLDSANLPLSATQKAAVLKRLKDMPASYRGRYLRALTGKARGAAMRHFCCECMGYDREAVKECTAPACALWPYRPGGKETSK